MKEYLKQTQRWLVLVLQSLVLAACVKTLELPSVTEPTLSGPERRLLVTFVDREISRSLPGNPQDRYQSRGQYRNTSWSIRIADHLAERYHLRFVAAWPVTTIGEACVVYEVPPDEPLEETLASLARDPEVASAQTMRTFRVMGQQAGPTSYNDPYFRLQKDLQAMRIDLAHRLATGKGVRIAVIDSGIDAQHPDLVRRVAFSENLATQTPGEPVDDIHGTAVAGVIAAQPDNGIGIVGIAPGVELYGLRACWPERRGSAASSCNSFTLALALNEAIRRKVDIINLSLTGPGDPLLTRLIRVALERGILIVAADSGKSDAFPARVPGVIAVGSAQDQTSKPAFSSLTAPGTAILTTLPQARYDFMSGSSFAAPHITGILALMREVRPSLTGPEALAVLKTAALDTQYGVDACQALTHLRGSGSCP
jgi:subtilisin family serine protease